jgi:flagellar motor switch protein FliM
METNTRFIKSIAMDEIVAVIVMNVRIGNVKGVLTCCVPCMGIGETLDSLNQTDRQEKDLNSQQKEEIRQGILHRVQNADVEVRGILGRTTITMREVLSLQPGDVIKLDQHLDEPISIIINGKKWISGRPGISRNQMAVKIGKPQKKEGHVL